MVDRPGFRVSAGLQAPAQTRGKPAMPDPLKNGDVYEWALAQAALIRAGRYQDIDWINVADEIESVGKSEFRSLVSRLTVLLTHMLKWDYQEARRSRSWVNTMEEQRDQIAFDLSDSPSLGSRRDEAIGRGYKTGRHRASSETNLPLSAFPPDCPYDWDAIMTRAFVLDQTDEAS